MRAALVVVALIAGLALGFVAGRATVAVAAAPVEPLAAETGGVENTLREVRSELAALRDGLRAPTSGSERAGAAPPSPRGPVDELERRIAQLETQRAEPATPARTTTVTARGFPTLEHLWSALDAGSVVPVSVQGRAPSLSDALAREHLLWTVEQVVATYGVPTSVHDGDGLTLVYRREGAKPGSVEQLQFRVADGRVYHVIAT
jgi:hypothetical protein